MERTLSPALRLWLRAKRGRATKLAEAAGLSDGFISMLADGQRGASMATIRLIADHTGLSIAALLGEPPGLAEPHAVPFAGPDNGNRLRATAETVAPGCRHPQWLRMQGDSPDFGLRSGDMIVFEASFDESEITAGTEIVAQVTDETGSARTLVCRVATPWLIGERGRIVGQLGANANAYGILRGIARISPPPTSPRHLLEKHD